MTGRDTYVPRLAFENSISGNAALSPREDLNAIASGGTGYMLNFSVFIMTFACI